MSLKRKSPELPHDTDTLITKRRRLLGDMLGSAPSTADPPPDSLDTWLTAVSVAEHGTDEGSLVIHRRSADDANPIPRGLRTCILYTNKGGGTLVACAYVDNRSGIPESKIYVSDSTAIDAATIEQAIRCGENDLIEELHLVPMCAPYSVVAVATCLCMHRPVSNTIAAFPPIWSYAIDTHSASSTVDDLDMRDALATVEDLLPPAAAVISAVAEVGSAKQGGRLSTVHLSKFIQSQRQAKSFRDALQVKTVLAASLLADAAHIAYLISIALGRLGSTDESPDVQAEIDSCKAKLQQHRNLPQNRIERARVASLEKELEVLEGGRSEVPDERPLEVVQQHMHCLAGFVAARRMEYEDEISLYESK